MTTAARSAAPHLPRAARYYARHGYHVFALLPRAKTPVTEHRSKDATTDLDAIAQMFREPTRNVAIATGAASGVIMLDVDGPEGEASLAELVCTHGALPATPETRTGRGRHLYFAHPGEGFTIKNSDSKLGPGLDVRGDGCYVVAPPSIHPDGARYVWADGCRLDQIRPAALPA